MIIWYEIRQEIKQPHLVCNRFFHPRTQKSYASSIEWVPQPLYSLTRSTRYCIIVNTNSIKWRCKSLHYKFVESYKCKLQKDSTIEFGIPGIYNVANQTIPRSTIQDPRPRSNSKIQDPRSQIQDPRSRRRRIVLLDTVRDRWIAMYSWK